MSRQDKPFRADCNHYLQLLPMIDFYATFYCTHCGGVRSFPALDLSTKTPEALGVELLAELGGTVGPAVPLELPRWADDDEFEPGRAVALAHQSGNEDTAKLLAKVVDVVDVETGTVRLKKKVDDADEMALDTRSTKTVRVKK